VYVLLNEIKQGSARISEIVGALKSYSYLGQAPIQLINVHEGIDNTLVILRNKLKTGVTVVREYDSNLPPISAYGSELNQVWTNILDNAWDAMSGNGMITIRTKRDGANIAVEIEDNGPGIPREIQTRIFDPFFTTKEPGKGTGLGLSTSYSIVVEKHNGTITVTSEPGKTCFRVTLPVEPPKS
jgi:signal transduction histidine kinase